MPMPLEQYNNLLAELNDGTIEHSRRTEILTELRNDYNAVVSDVDTYEKRVTQFEKDNNDLIVSNSKLFRQAGIVGNTEKIEEVKEKEFSETVTLEQLEKTY